MTRIEPIINQDPGDEQGVKITFTMGKICKCKKCNQIEKCTLVDGDWICEGCA